MGVGPFSHPMTFKQRAINLFAVLFGIPYQYFMMNYYDSVLDKFLPHDQRPQRPSLPELENEIGLALHFGNPMIMDGLRPVAPNFVMVGMLNCKPAKPLPNDLKKFIEGKS